MCGIVGYIGKDNVVPVLVEGLKKLEYRGYDSAGIAFLQDGELVLRRSVGKLRELESQIAGEALHGNVGIGHTRWATHGRPCEENAHPHRAGDIVVVHNGIIENYLHLKRQLMEEGCIFASETDTEVICHLINRYVRQGQDLETAVRSAIAELKGAYAIGVINKAEPDKVIGARDGSPLIVGLAAGEFFIASDVPAILAYTRDVIILEDGEMAVLTPEGVQVKDLEGNPRDKQTTKIMWNPVMAEKSGYKHFMLKEIYEQPRAIMDTIRGRISQDSGDVYLEDVHLTADELRGIRKIFIVACGTSWHSGLVGKFMIEELARISVEVDIASEFRYRSPIIDGETLIVPITQSGETADTLAATKEARRLGAKVISICNVVGSSITRESDGVIHTHAGPEIGVASTKAFTAQLTAIFLLALHLGRIRGILTSERSREYMEELVKIPGRLERIFEDDEKIAEVARHYNRASDFLFLGRGYNYPIALEGALKLKEISYIHAEGYPAGEMKHGPIALIDENLPVVVIAPKDRIYEKVLGNVEEVKARGGQVIAIASEGDHDIASKANHVFFVPETIPQLTPLLTVVPLQLLSYHVAEQLGCDVDQPRNLAKSVTVE